MQYKGCLRCHGDVYLEDDLGYQDLVCLQCGSRRPAGQATSTTQDEAQFIRWISAERPAAKAAA